MSASVRIYAGFFDVDEGGVYNGDYTSYLNYDSMELAKGTVGDCVGNHNCLRECLSQGLRGFL